MSKTSDHKTRFTTLRTTRDSLRSLLDNTQDALAVIEGQMEEAAEAWAQATGREAVELIEG